MHSENLADHDLCLKSLEELEEWCKQDGVEDMAKLAGNYHKFELSHKDQI